MEQSYLNLANIACRFENQKCWQEASQAWREALTFAKKGSRDEEWAENRLDFCISRFRSRLQNPILREYDLWHKCMLK